MEGFQFIDIIILAMVAGFIVLRLRSVLGRRTGHEPTRDARPEEGYARGTANAPDNIVTIPGAAQRRSRENALDIEPAYQGTPMEAGLVQIKMADPSFSVSRFGEGAAKAFELIVNAYAQGDTDTLKPLLSPEVYGQFANAIQDRETRGETMETELVVLKPPKVEAISVEDMRASIDVRFQSEQVNVIKNSAGEIIDGDREHVDSVTDVWTFARDLSSRDPNWVLVATRSVE
ncbi:MAG: Tim44/TimA family putative adaptor protein [Proteobacteria bacterium]|nr:Tim44/TimA family putative adaptor protein [Pseudomonadota bacterium]